MTFIIKPSNITKIHKLTLSISLSEDMETNKIISIPAGDHSWDSPLPSKARFNIDGGQAATLGLLTLVKVVNASKFCWVSSLETVT